MQSTAEVLQIEHVLSAIAELAKTERGRKALLSLRPLPLAERETELGNLTQATVLIDLGGPIPVNDSSDLAARIDAAKKGATLEALDFSRMLSDLNALRDIKKYLYKNDPDSDLSKRVLSLPELEPLRQAILRVIAPDLSIKDNASVELKRIRSTLAHKKKELVARLGDILEQHRPYLSGNSWTMRNGHYVLPIANSFKHQVRGLVQDVSASGGTTFIEPEFLVRMQNDIALLESDEKEEIRRILAALSRQLGSNASDCAQINAAIGYLDFLQSKKLYADKLHCHIGILSPDGALRLPAARHPLLDQSKVVANDFYLSQARRILVLSGPNAGGKTVALKTLGTLVYMHSMALPIPCGAGAEIPDFGNVYLDIGDSQSLFDNLSTFSGHVKNIQDILSVAKKDDLILLDEVGTGTSPREGEALALAILDTLGKKGCYALVSSHFEGLKARALSSTDVENASLLFDEVSLQPTYSLRIGIPGESYGLEVARRLGLEEEVLDLAKSYLGDDVEGSVSDSLRHLSELTREAELARDEANRLRDELRRNEDEARRVRDELNRKKKAFDEQMGQERARMIAEAEAEIDEIIREMNNPDVKPHQAIAAKKRLEGLEEAETAQTFDGPIAVGDFVEVPAYGIEGRVTRVNGKRIEVTTRDGIPFSLEKNSARKIAEPERKPPVQQVTNVDVLPSQGLPLEVNLIGMRVAEAMAELDRYLDRCRLKGFKRVRVIHGLGSGALRKATHEYLKAHSSFVERFELGGEFEGGGGATVVYLK